MVGSMAEVTLAPAARRTDRRAPDLEASDSRAAVTSTLGGRPTGPVRCTTPIERPRTRTGTHTAEQGPEARPRRCGQASKPEEAS